MTRDEIVDWLTKYYEGRKIFLRAKNITEARHGDKPTNTEMLEFVLCQVIEDGKAIAKLKKKLAPKPRVKIIVVRNK